ncbi:MAG: galactokinase family protein [Thermoguttaceae bacterium]
MTELSHLGDLTDPDGLAQQLAATGLSGDACELKARWLIKARTALAVVERPDRVEPPVAFFVPGRLELLGKHTDYAGGRTMVAAVERGFCFVALPRNDSQIFVLDAVNGQAVRFGVDPEWSPPADSWAEGPMTVVRRMARDFPGATRGADIAMVSDLVPDSGLGASAAMAIGVFLILSEVNRLSARDDYWHNLGGKTDLAGYLSAVLRSRAFGDFAADGDETVFCGGEDQAAILCAEPGHIARFGYGPIELEKLLPMPPGYLFAVAASGASPECGEDGLTPADLPERSVRKLLELWRQATGRDDPHLAAALGSAPDAVDRLRAIVAAWDDSLCGRESLLARLEHFELEGGALLPVASAALAVGDLRTFGRLVDRSQQAAERLLGNQTPETVFLAAHARRLGAAAATSFGRGFGGSVWAMVETDHAADFLDAWSDAYRIEYPEMADRAVFFHTAAGPAAFRVS